MKRGVKPISISASKTVLIPPLPESSPQKAAAFPALEERGEERREELTASRVHMGAWREQNARVPILWLLVALSLQLLPRCRGAIGHHQGAFGAGRPKTKTVTLTPHSRCGQSPLRLGLETWGGDAHLQPLMIIFHPSSDIPCYAMLTASTFPDEGAPPIHPPPR